jgi:ribonuclease BN (tRNA processing enzyme)
MQTAARNSFTILGSSSGMPQATRACSGYLLKTGKSLSLIDCGGGVTASFLRCGFRPLDVDRVFISHTHPDHCCDLPLFIQMQYLAGRLKPLEIYLPEEFVEPFRAFMNAVYLLPDKLPFDMNVIGCRNGFVFSDAFRLTMIGNRHLHGYVDYIDRLRLPNRMQCHSFMIEVDGGKSLFYSADIRDLNDMASYLDGHDYVVIETTHIDLDQLMEQAAVAGMGKFVLTHLGTADEVDHIRQKIAKGASDRFIIAHDGLTLEL